MTQPSASTARSRGPRDTGGSAGRAPAPCEHSRDASRDRYAAVVAALMEVRPDEATAHFDAEIARAVAEGRLDTQTARSLRWWQQASVRAAESYATTVVPGVLAVRDEAEAATTREAIEAAAAWRTALDAIPASPATELTSVRLLLTPAPKSAVHARTRQAIRAAIAPQPSTEVDFQ